MKNLDMTLFRKDFQYIYIEESVLEHPNTRKILSHFPNAVQIVIHHYKDMFCRGKQNIQMQKKALSLILAQKNGTFLYPGAPVCENFGHANFYYTSCIMNCLYQCEYCYLQGMYASGNIVVFVNIEDVFKELEQILKQKPVYLCISYDTDLLAFEPLTGYVVQWIQFAKIHPDLTIEIRTKSANHACVNSLTPVPNVIFAWTLSPQRIAERYEHRTPSTLARIDAAKTLIDSGWNVRLCLDPILYQKDWEELYTSFLQEIFQIIDGNKVNDISLGVFRVSKEYLKKMRKQNPDSSVLFYPYTLNAGVYEYSKDLTHNMITVIKQNLLKYIAPDKIYTWEDVHDGGNQE